MPIRCQCGKALLLETGITNLFPNTDCPACNVAIWSSEDGLVRTRTLDKAWKQLQSGDFIFAIVFSALAVECELARAFMRWKNIDSGLFGNRPSASEEHHWLGSLRNCGILQRLDRVCRFLTEQSFDAFLGRQSALTQSLHGRHPESISTRSLRTFFNEHLFHKRDQIVYSGKKDFGNEEAKDSFESALTLFQIISEMEFNRSRRLQENLKSPHTSECRECP
jgi:hypothetical protein